MVSVQRSLLKPIKLGYAALSAGQVALWMAKEGGYLLKVWHRSGAHLYSRGRSYPGADRRRDSTGASDRGLYFRGYLSRGGRANHRQHRSTGSSALFTSGRKLRLPEDLKGKKLGISRFGALSETGAAIFLERFGLKRGTDVAIIQLGGLPEIITAMEKGAVQAGFASPPQFEPG